VATIKLLPALQQVYMRVTQIHGHSASFYAIKSALTTGSSEVMGDDSCPTDRLVNMVNFEALEYEGILSSISVSLKGPGVYGVTGPSGAGKSTLLALLVGMKVPTSGAIQFRDDEGVIKSTDVPMGYVPQEIALINGTLRENILFGRKDISEADIRSITSSVGLAAFDLSERMTRMISADSDNLSGGQKQRIGIARAMLSKPSVLVLDEPTSALDVISRDAIIELLSQLGYTAIVIFVTHDESLLKICNHVYQINAGKLSEK
jgi:ABC-type bacteriocin/lantibiotic exporter with double-glycine peptidase domain